MARSENPFSQLRPLAAALIVTFGMVSHSVCAAPQVTNCDDHGLGSLRDAVMAAAQSDTVDASHLSCSKISLTTGSIDVGQSALTITGPGTDKLAIVGPNNAPGSRLITQHGPGALALNNMTLGDNYFYTNDATGYVGGGCVFAKGDLTLDHVVLYACTSVSGKRPVHGGAAYVGGDITITNSIIRENIARTTPSAFLYLPYSQNRVYYLGSGGGLFVKGNAIVDHSTIVNNVTFADVYAATYSGDGGGIKVRGNADIRSSTISRNVSGTGSGILCSGSLTVANSTISGNGIGAAISMQSAIDRSGLIVNSTISGNSGTAFYTNAPSAIYNSTIAFNVSYETAAAVSSSRAGTTLLIESSIVADNFPADLDVKSGSRVVSGAHSIVVHSSVSVPGAMTVCPQLKPLADNGGPTHTHALQHTSPAIDAGSNLRLLQSDQTGHSRVFGTNADIGAFERSGGTDESVFRDGFDDPNPFCELELVQ